MKVCGLSHHEYTRSRNIIYEKQEHEKEVEAGSAKCF